MNSLYFVMLRWLLLSSPTVGSFMSSAAPPNSQVGKSLLGSHWLNLKVPEPAQALQNLSVHRRADISMEAMNQDLNLCVSTANDSQKEKNDVQKVDI
ncbi:hypothetical protein Hanom_Chr06g00527901 [Helianthus anomalus]